MTVVAERQGDRVDAATGSCRRRSARSTGQRLCDRERACRGASERADDQVGDLTGPGDPPQPQRGEVRQVPIHDIAAAGRTKKPTTWRSASSTTRPIPSARSSARLGCGPRCSSSRTEMTGTPNVWTSPPYWRTFLAHVGQEFDRAGAQHPLAKRRPRVVEAPVEKCLKHRDGSADSAVHGHCDPILDGGSPAPAEALERSLPADVEQLADLRPMYGRQPVPVRPERAACHRRSCRDCASRQSRA